MEVPHNIVIILKILRFKNSYVIGRLSKDWKQITKVQNHQVGVREKCASSRAPKYVSKYEITLIIELDDDNIRETNDVNRTVVT